MKKSIAITGTAGEPGSVANRLEAAMELMHTSAYQPALKAVRLLRAAAKEGGTDESQDKNTRLEVAADLRRYSQTVSTQARTCMLDAAETLDRTK